MPPKKTVAKMPTVKAKSTRARKPTQRASSSKTPNQKLQSSPSSLSSLSPNTRANTRRNSMTNPAPEDIFSDSSSDDEHRSRSREPRKSGNATKKVFNRTRSGSRDSERTALSKSSAGGPSTVFRSPSQSPSSDSSNTKSRDSSSSSRSSSESSDTSTTSSSSSTASKGSKRSRGSAKAKKRKSNPKGKRSRSNSANSRKSDTSRTSVNYYTNSLPRGLDWNAIQQMVPPPYGSPWSGCGMPIDQNVRRTIMRPKPPHYSNRTKRAKIVLQVSRVRNQMKRERPGKRIGHRTAVVVSAIAQYIVTELLEMSADAAGLLKKKRITPRCLNMAIQTDEEMAYLFKNDIIAHAGYVKKFY
ncbi:unnamed protein product [Bursaphelenchus okinawaensis]|uniref:Core Histone H2A/H2B/H3 domain-containing protein n=1 Tax=Bursaphelenchus okinawaensis TaxID=465554 RepID=A0A811JS03_9BILA|nr:unnamed protein product [Bursaphelenchus okinawaensis]CAG9080434.1 unnamed protein product [Bursaphelenchus okinawaensis]